MAIVPIGVVSRFLVLSDLKRKAIGSLPPAIDNYCSPTVFGGYQQLEKRMSKYGIRSVSKRASSINDERSLGNIANWSDHLSLVLSDLKREAIDSQLSAIESSNYQKSEKRMSKYGVSCRLQFTKSNSNSSNSSNNSNKSSSNNNSNKQQQAATATVASATETATASASASASARATATTITTTTATKVGGQTHQEDREMKKTNGNNMKINGDDNEVENDGEMKGIDHPNEMIREREEKESTQAKSDNNNKSSSSSSSRATTATATTTTTTKAAAATAAKTKQQQIKMRRDGLSKITNEGQEQTYQKDTDNEKSTVNNRVTMEEDKEFGKDGETTSIKQQTESIICRERSSTRAKSDKNLNSNEENEDNLMRVQQIGAESSSTAIKMSTRATSDRKKTQEECDESQERENEAKILREQRRKAASNSKNAKNGQPET